MNYSRINQKFLGEYLELDKALCQKLDSKAGVTEYINKLNGAKYAPGRDNSLHRLIKYRGLRNRIAHEPGALKDIDNITRDDIIWLKGFKKQVMRGKDPLSVYLKKASSRIRNRALKRTLLLAGIGAAAVLAAVAVIVLL